MAVIWTWLLSSFCVFAHMGGVRTSIAEDYVEMREMYMYIGETLHINCSLPKDSPWWVKNLEFTLDSGHCESKSDHLCTFSEADVREANNHTLALSKVLSSLEQAGDYTCWVPHSSSGRNSSDKWPIYIYTVFLQYRPQAVEAVRCVAAERDYDVRVTRDGRVDVIVTCHWHHGVRYNDHSTMEVEAPKDISVTASLRKPQSGDPVQCPHALSLLNTRCRWPGTLFYPADDQYTLEVNVTNTKRQDHAVKTIHGHLRDIFKPLPVVSARVEERNSTCVTLRLMRNARAHWNRVNCKANFSTARDSKRLPKSHVGNSSSRNSSNRSSRNSSSSITLCGLEPYTSYNVSAQCRAFDRQGPHGLWSDVVSSLVIQTAEAAPGASFGVHPGGYVRHICSEAGYGDVTVLLKAVPHGERHGPITGYRVELNNGTVLVDYVITDPSSSSSSTPLSSPASTSASPTSAVIPEVSCTAPVPVRIFARNSAGLSLTFSSLLIWPETTHTVSEFAVEVSTEHNWVRAVWNEEKDVDSTDVITDVITTDDAYDDVSRGQAYSGDNVTVFLCLKNSTALVPTCREQAEITWQSVAFSAGQLDLTSRFQQHQQGQSATNPHKHLFGISRRAQGILWTSCLFPVGADLKAPENVRAEGGEGQLEVRWSAHGCSPTYLAHVIGYLVHLCPRAHCPERNWTVRVDGWQTDRQTVPAVEAGVDYVVRVQVRAFGGREGPLSAPVTVTPLATPSQVWKIAGMVIATLLISACLFGALVICCRDSVRMKCRKFADPSVLFKPEAGDADCGRAEDHEDDTPHPTTSRQQSSASSSTATTVLSMDTAGDRGEGGAEEKGGTDAADDSVTLHSPPASPQPPAAAVLHVLMEELNYRGHPPGRPSSSSSPPFSSSSSSLSTCEAIACHGQAVEERYRIVGGGQNPPARRSDGVDIPLIPLSPWTEGAAEAVVMVAQSSEGAALEEELNKGRPTRSDGANIPLIPVGPGTLEGQVEAMVVMVAQSPDGAVLEEEEEVGRSIHGADVPLIVPRASAVLAGGQVVAASRRSDPRTRHSGAAPGSKRCHVGPYVAHVTAQSAYVSLTSDSRPTEEDLTTDTTKC